MRSIGQRFCGTKRAARDQIAKKMSWTCIDSCPAAENIRANRGIPDLAVPHEGFYKRD
jgi:hypothetical protein